MPTNTEIETLSFDELWLSEKSLKAVQKKWFTKATPIQSEIIPLFLKSSKDLIWQANTWTWKTAAFGLPLLDLIDHKTKQTQAIILVPTRELAKQVFEELQDFNIFHKHHIALFYWWKNMYNEKRELKQNPQIVVWTPWRIKDYVSKNLLHLDNIKYFVLDEADEMLNVWFREDIEYMMSKTNKNRRTLLFSATMPRWILDIVNKYMNEYHKVSIKSKSGTNKNIEQKRYEVHPRYKFEALCSLIEIEQEFYWIIFCRTKLDVDEVSKALNKRWFSSEALHWDIDQKNRERILQRFKTWKTKILVATDVAARWIDVDDLTHVINFSLPENPEIYTHRVWRTGRAGKQWVAISLVPRQDVRKLFFIERIINKKIEKWQLPNQQDLIKIKKEKILTKIKWIIEKTSDLEFFDDLASNLLEIWDAKTIIKAMLQDKYDISVKKIPENTFENKFWSNKDEIRIFIAKWRSWWFWVWDIIKLIKNEIHIDDKKIRNIRILDNFSFATLPYQEWDALIHLFKKKAKWRKPLIVKAKERR